MPVEQFFLSGEQWNRSDEIKTYCPGCGAPLGAAKMNVEIEPSPVGFSGLV